MKKLISIDLFADFGMLKKPDTNEPVYLTFNILHKPVLLGILGAIIGLEGFKEKGKLPEYYEKLKDLKVGIQPLNHENGNFQKTTLTYNNTTGMASKEQGGNLMITEQTLIAPAFRCYFLLDTDNELHQKIDNNLSTYNAEFLPYLGKNEFSIWWEEYKSYGFNSYNTLGSFRISSIFIKDKPLKDNRDMDTLLNYDPVIDDILTGCTFSYFERLPVGYIDIGKSNYQYNYCNFAYTDWGMKLKNKSYNTLLKIHNEEIIQVF